MLKGLGNYWNQLRSGNAEVYGETVFNVVSTFIGGTELKGAANVAKASEADSLLSKAGLFTKTLGKSGLNNAKNLATMPGRALDNIGNIFEGKGPNYAFAHVGGNESVLNKIGREADALPKNDVQNNFNKVMGEANDVERTVSSSPTAIPKEHSDFLGNDGKVPAVTKPYNEFKVQQPEWADEEGYVNWNHEDAPKGENGFLNGESKDYIPRAGEQSDRFGNSGSFSSPITDNKSYEFPDRALPHEQSSLPYRRFENTIDLTPNNIREAYNAASQNVKDKLDVWSIRNHKGLSFEDWMQSDKNLVTKRGVAEEGWKQPGGAIQDMYPMPDDKLELLGLIEYK